MPCIACNTASNSAPAFPRQPSRFAKGRRLNESSDEQEKVHESARLINKTWFFDGLLLKAPWIDPVQGVVADVGVEVDVSAVAGWIPLEEAAEGGGVVPCTVIIKAGLGVILAAGEGEAVADGGGGEGSAGGIGDGELAVGIVGVALKNGPCGAGEGDDGAEAIGMVIGGGAASFDADRLVDAGAVGVLGGDGAGGIRLREELVAVVEETEGWMKR